VRGDASDVAVRADDDGRCARLGLQWWIADEGALVLSFIVIPILFGLYVSVLFVPVALTASLVTSAPVAWRWVSALAW
jgi:hypothetical protein